LRGWYGVADISSLERVSFRITAGDWTNSLVLRVTSEFLFLWFKGNWAISLGCGMAFEVVELGCGERENFNGTERLLNGKNLL
jgi:hypothetical protein